MATGSRPHLEVLPLRVQGNDMTQRVDQEAAATKSRAHLEALSYKRQGSSVRNLLAFMSFVYRAGYWLFPFALSALAWPPNFKASKNRFHGGDAPSMKHLRPQLSSNSSHHQSVETYTFRNSFGVLISNLDSGDITEKSNRPQKLLLAIKHFASCSLSNTSSISAQIYKFKEWYFVR